MNIEYPLSLQSWNTTAKLKQVYTARSNHSMAEHVFYVKIGGREKTNLEMDLYWQAVSVREEQLLPSTKSTERCHTQSKLCSHLRLVASCFLPQRANLSSR